MTLTLAGKLDAPSCLPQGGGTLIGRAWAPGEIGGPSMVSVRGDLYDIGALALTDDRDAPGMGFTHKRGDIVTISAPELGSPTNRVTLSTEAAPWTFGAGELMRNLAARNLL